MAMSKGIQMMLQALGITIDPAEIEEIFRKLQKDLPAAATYITAQFESIGAQLREIETKMREIEELLACFQEGRRMPPETRGVKVNGKSAAE